MADMQNFFLWFLQELANFLLSDPIKYFTGIFLGMCAVGLFRRICGLR